MAAVAMVPAACWIMIASRPAFAKPRSTTLRPQQLCSVWRNSGVRSAPVDCSATPRVDLEPTTPVQHQTTSRWEAFAAGCSGEWEGVTATFTASGRPTALAEYYVPQAYREWGVTLYDWQSNCSMHCSGTDGLSYTQRRMMPTVGCEADAIAFTSQQQQLFTPGHPSATVAADGSYSAGPADLAAAEIQSAAVEHCLVLRQGQRVRVVHNLQRPSSGSSWEVVSIDVLHERYDAPYNGKGELGGCGGGMEPFAESATLDRACLEGSWAVAAGVEYAFDQAGASCSEVEAVGKPWSFECSEGLVLLPLGIWTSAALSDEDVSVQVGTIVEEDTMRLASRHYKQGRLSSSSIQTLKRADR